MSQRVALPGLLNAPRHAAMTLAQTSRRPLALEPLPVPLAQIEQAAAADTPIPGPGAVP